MGLNLVGHLVYPGHQTLDPHAKIAFAPPPLETGHPEDPLMVLLG